MPGGKLQSSGLADFLDDLASAAAIPGGGSSAALAGAIGAGLVAMVCRVTIKYQHDLSADALGQAALRADELRRGLMGLIDLDGESFKRVIEANKTKNAEAIQSALIFATETPLRTAALCEQALALAASIKDKTRSSAQSDLKVGALLAQAGLRGAVVTAESNFRDLHDDKFVAAQQVRIAQMLAQAENDLKHVQK